MTSLRGLGWPGDTGLRVPVQALDGDSASRRFGNGAAARGVGNGAAANGADGGTSGPVGGAPDAVRRAGSLGWPPATAPHLDRHLGGASDGRVGGQAASVGPERLGSHGCRTRRRPAWGADRMGRGSAGTGDADPSIRSRPRLPRLAVPGPGTEGLLTGRAGAIIRSGFT